MNKEFIGIIIKDNQVVDLMRHYNEQESLNNLEDSVQSFEDAHSASCWKVEEDTVELVQELDLGW